MEVSRIIAELDGQIAKLQQARALLADSAAPAVHVGRGRPKGSKNTTVAATAAAPAKATTRKRKLSPEGRKRIADAMKKRWAERRKQTAK